jgi:hypothetical protein
VASPIPLPAQPARRGGRMLSELAPVMTTSLSLIPGMKICFPASTFQCQVSFSDGFFFKSRAIDFNFSCADCKL